MSYAEDRERREASRGGYMVTSDAYTGMVHFPTWSDTVFTPTTIVPIGPVMEGGMRFAPHREGDGECQYSQWICARHVVRGWGTTKQFTFLASQKDPVTGQFRDQQVNPNPVYQLWNAYKALCKTDKNWETLGTGAKGRRAAIGRPDNCGFIQGMICEIGGKSAWAAKSPMQPIHPAILGFSRSGRVAYETALEEKDKATGLLIHRDIFDPNNVIAVRVYNEKTEPGTQAAPQQNQMGVPMLGHGQARTERGGDDVSRFKADLVQLGPMSPGPDGRPYLVGLNAFVSWDKALRYLSDEEMIDILCSAFQDHPQLLIYALGRNYKLPATILNASTSIPMGAPMSPAAGAPAIGVPGVGVPMMGGMPRMQQPGYPHQPAMEDEAMAAAAPAVGVSGQMLPPPPQVGQPVPWGAAQQPNPAQQEENRLRQMGLAPQMQPPVQGQGAPGTPPLPVGIPGGAVPQGYPQAGTAPVTPPRTMQPQQPQQQFTQPPQVQQPQQQFIQPPPQAMQQQVQQPQQQFIQPPPQAMQQQVQQPQQQFIQPPQVMQPQQQFVQPQQQQFVQPPPQQPQQQFIQPPQVMQPQQQFVQPPPQQAQQQFIQPGQQPEGAAPVEGVSGLAALSRARQEMNQQ